MITSFTQFVALGPQFTNGTTQSFYGWGVHVVMLQLACLSPDGSTSRPLANCRRQRPDGIGPLQLGPGCGAVGSLCGDSRACCWCSIRLRTSTSSRSTRLASLCRSSSRNASFLVAYGRGPQKAPAGGDPRLVCHLQQLAEQTNRVRRYPFYQLGRLKTESARQFCRGQPLTFQLFHTFNQDVTIVVRVFMTATLSESWQVKTRR